MTKRTMDLISEIFEKSLKINYVTNTKTQVFVYSSPHIEGIGVYIYLEGWSSINQKADYSFYTLTGENEILQVLKLLKELEDGKHETKQAIS